MNTKAIALYDNHETDENELAFEEDDVIIITNMENKDGWWTGFLENDQTCTEGLFPNNFVKLITKTKNKVNYESTDSSNSEEINEIKKSKISLEETSGSELEEESLGFEDNESITLDNRGKRNFLKKDFSWSKKASNENPKIVEITEEGKFHKTYQYRIKSATVRGIRTRTWSDFQSLESLYRNQYPDLFVPPLLDFSPNGANGFNSIGESRLYTGGLFLKRISSHPILSNDSIYLEFLRADSAREFKKAKKIFKSESDEFWTTVKTNRPPPDIVVSQQLDKFRTNLKTHSKISKILSREFTSISLVCYSEYHNGLIKMIKILKKWSHIPFDWRINLDENDKQINQKISDLIISWSSALKKIAASYHTQSKEELNEIICYFTEYKEMFSNILPILKRREKLDKKSRKLQNSQATLESINTGTLKGRMKAEKGELKLNSLRSKSEATTNIIIAETEYLKQHRLKDTGDLLKSYINGQIKFFKRNAGIMKGIRNEITQFEKIISKL
ncbi:sorting nexin [Anaeramoeba flamelloides]|uniref:Sorting nexin n=1 Tax=Anaeramoeba flamelloides TaxID=1746091 RepID=A0AAV7ZE93_9EUKA|nr:sorting nexin [Anaeramoeba flamelloides]